MSKNIRIDHDFWDHEAWDSPGATPFARLLMVWLASKSNDNDTSVRFSERMAMFELGASSDDVTQALGFLIRTGLVESAPDDGPGRPVLLVKHNFIADFWED